MVASMLQTDCSLSLIVAVAAFLAIVPELALLIDVIIVSLVSGSASSLTATCTVLLVSPAAKLKVWFSAV